MSHIFISYSRRDLDSVRKIVETLLDKELKIWVDWDNIPKGEDWEQEIYRGIEEAEAFLFFISPDSVASGPCNDEIAHALKNGKRILPVFVSKVENKEVYSVTKKFPNEEHKGEINRRNFVFCRDGMDDFDKAIDEIITTIETDYEWLKFHTRLQVKAVEWEKSNKDNSHLLRGKELREAEEKLGKAGNDAEPSPTDIQKLFLDDSLKHEKVLKRRYIGIGIAVFFVIVGLVAYPYLSRERAIPGKWIDIPEGEFTMGMDQQEAEAASSLCMEEVLESQTENCPSPESLLSWSGMITKVELPKFSILENEVTNAQYQQCVDSGTCIPPVEWSYEEGGANLPATGLNWFETGEYCTWLGGRLPTEIEWEKSASGPGNTNNYFPWGNTWEPAKANLVQSGIGSIQSIARYAESDVSYYGVKNLAGNAREWTASESTQLDADMASMNVVLELANTNVYFPITVRGGAWINDPSTGMTSTRGTDGSIVSRPTLGFRCVCPNGQTCASPWTWSWIWLGKY